MQYEFEIWLTVGRRADPQTNAARMQKRDQFVSRLIFEKSFILIRADDHSFRKSYSLLLRMTTSRTSLSSDQFALLESGSTGFGK